MRIGTISYNIYCNFTNYGSALQTWALHQAIQKAGHTPILVDYCPDILTDKNPLDPYKYMWDKDEESRRMVELTMPSIRINYDKYMAFFEERFNKTNNTYYSNNFNRVVIEENIDGFVCGSDTIFCPDEFGIDDGFYANYKVMQGNSVAYAASFGDPHFNEEMYCVLNDRLKNFKALGIRESLLIDYLNKHTSAPVKKVVDPTLLLRSEEYDSLLCKKPINEKYLLLYARRYSPVMEEYAERVAKEKGLTIVEISLRSINRNKGHIMAYSAGVEEFLTLIKNAELVITNSYHGLIFSVQFKRPVMIFSREQCDSKISELLELLGLNNRLLITGTEPISDIDYNLVHNRISIAREESFAFLKMELDLLRGS